MKKYLWFVLPLLVFMGCGRGCSVSKEIERTEETRTMANHKVKIACIKYEQTTTYIPIFRRNRSGRIHQSTGYFIDFSVKIDHRPELKSVCYVGLAKENAQETKDLIKKFNIRFSANGDHLECSMNDHKEIFHVLPKGAPFSLAFEKNEQDPWAGMDIDKLPPVREMLKKIITEDQTAKLYFTTELREALKAQPAPSVYDNLMVQHLCRSSLAIDVFTPGRVQTCAKNNEWKKLAEQACYDTVKALECEDWYTTTIIFAANDSMLRWYDTHITSKNYIDLRLSSKRLDKEYRKNLQAMLHKEIDPYVQPGFPYSKAYNVFNYAHALKDPLLVDKLYKAIMNTENFDNVALALHGDAYAGFSTQRQEKILEHAIQSFKKDPKPRWSTWNFIADKASCARINAILKSNREISAEYSRPMRCD